MIETNASETTGFMPMEPPMTREDVVNQMHQRMLRLAFSGSVSEPHTNPVYSASSPDASISQIDPVYLDRDSKPPMTREEVVSQMHQRMLGLISAPERPVSHDVPATALATAQTSKVVERQPRTPTVVRRFGWAVVGMAGMVTVALLGGSIAGSERATVATGGSVEIDSAAQESSASTTTEAPTTTTTEAPTTTTTETPLPRTFEAQPGELIGVLKVDEICLEASIYEFDESDKTQQRVGTGGAVIDQLIPEDDPAAACAPVQQYADSVRNDPSHPEYNPELMTRADWVRNSSRGHVNQWEPVAGHERNPDGPLSVYPGQPGNAVISGHGSTYSAPFADMSVLKPGSFMVFERSDGASFLYKVVAQELTADYATIHNYSHIESPSTLSVYNCSDESGNTGSDATRMVTRAVLVSTLS